MTEPQTHLPLASSEAERAVSIAVAGELALITPAILKTLYNPATVPAPFLPALGYALSVDQWDTGWTDAQKRAAIQKSLPLHALKGTNAAVLGALADLGISAEIIDWHDPRAAAQWDVSLRDSDGNPAPFTAQIQIDRFASNVSEEEINAAIRRNKRASVLFVTSLRTITATADLGIALAGYAEVSAQTFAVFVIGGGATEPPPAPSLPNALTLGGEAITFGGAPLTFGNA